MNNDQSSNNSTNQKVRKLVFTHGIEVENFITNKQGDILEDGKELVAVWDQMFNGALKYLKSLTSSTVKVPPYIRKKIVRVGRKDVERHGKIIRYVQIHYKFNGKTIAINVFGPDPNISQITWLLELVTPPCEYLEELDWWIKTLYLAATQSITKGYHIQPLGFNPFQAEYRAGVTCGEHHHLGGFKNQSEKKAAYNIIRAYIPHLIALTSTSPFINRQPTGRIIQKKGQDNRMMILAPDCIRSNRLNENSGQLGPNIPEYLPHVSTSFSQKQFSRYVRKEIPDDRYVDLYPFTSYNTIECRFFDTQFDQNIRLLIVILLQALALKGVKFQRAGKTIPEIRGSTLYEHRKRAVTFGMFAKFQGDPSIEKTGSILAKYYNHNPEDGGPPGKMFESLRALSIWLKPELKELRISAKEINPLLTMLWGTARIAPPISTATFMLYLYEQNRMNIDKVIQTLALVNGKPGKVFNDILGRSSKTFEEFMETKATKPIKKLSTTKSTLARKLQLDSRNRRKKAMAKERARIKAKNALKAKIEREKAKKLRELERKRQERLKLLEKAKKPPPKIASKTSNKKTVSPIKPRTRTARKTTKKTPRTKTQKQSILKPKPIKNKTAAAKKRRVSSRSKSQPRSASKNRKTTSSRRQSKKKVVTASARKNIRKRTTKRKTQAYASTASSSTRIKKTISRPSSSRTRSKKKRLPVTRKQSGTKVRATTKTVTKYEDLESYKHPKFVRSVKVYNLPSKIDFPIIIPVLKIRWKKSIIQSLANLPIQVSVEFNPLARSRKHRKKAFQENYQIERAALFKRCYLPIPIDLKKYSGEFQLKFVVKDKKNRTVLATAFSECMIEQKKVRSRHNIRKVTIPPNQVGDSVVNVKATLSQTNVRGRITILGLSQRGIFKLYDKKTRFKRKKINLDLPITIPPSICSSAWYLIAIFKGKGMTTTNYVKTSPPLSKVITLGFYGNPPLKSRIDTSFESEITPKLKFKAKANIREIEIFQVLDNKHLKSLKKYRLRSRIKKGEKFVLESFDWKTPSMRKGLFRSHDKRKVVFICKITDEFGLVDDSLIGIIETPSITVYNK